MQRLDEVAQRGPFSNTEICRRLGIDPAELRRVEQEPEQPRRPVESKAEPQAPEKPAEAPKKAAPKPKARSEGDAALWKWLGAWSWQVLGDRRLKDLDKAVAWVLYLKMHAEQGHKWYKKAWPQQRDIAKAVGKSRILVRYSLKALADCGHITVQEVPTSRGGRVFHVYTPKLWAEGSPSDPLRPLSEGSPSDPQEGSPSDPDLLT